jgi:glycosyltransferase involved in cell wall biosynthesis
MKSMPTVSVVIPAYNEQDTIEKCLSSFLHQTVRPLEVIVVDNRSTDETAARVRAFTQEHAEELNVRLLKQFDAQGIIPTRDYGMARAKGDIVGRIDADSTLDDGWVEAVQEGFADPSVAAASGPVVYHDMPAPNVGFRADNQIRSTLDKLAKSHRFLFGSNMAVRRSVWNVIVPHLCEDKEDKMHEDIDIALHLHLEGYKVVYLPDMIGGMSARRLEDSPKDFYRYVMRFENTYKAHDIKSATARIPIFIYLTTYFPTKFLRFIYDGDEQKFTFDKFRDMINRHRGDKPDDEIVI